MSVLRKISPEKTQSWLKLKDHFEEIKNISLRQEFLVDKERFSRFSIRWKEILLDYSKNLINEKTIRLLLELAEECYLKESITFLFSGEPINETENRSVLHSALRNRSGSPVYSESRNVMPQIDHELEKMRIFSENLRSGKIKGYSGKRISDLVNIGIGGSDLGPAMVCEAMKHYSSEYLKVHFVSNVDATHIQETISNLDPDTTFFIIVSKTFTTQETMTNAQTARDWFLKKVGNEEAAGKHFAAVTTNDQKAGEFGIQSSNLFTFWDWIGGRYSLWSAVGLSIMCSIGYDNYIDLHQGAYEMDKHFREVEFRNNIPVLLALIGIWYNNFWAAESTAILPYEQYLHRFPAYLQQADMESNGKNVDRQGKKISYQTGPVIWGEPGTNGQHAFYQLIHQGTKLIPCDFLAGAISLNPSSDHQEKLLANFFAQTEALMKGKNEKEIKQELEKEGKSEAEIKKLLPYKLFSGNRPSNSILYKKLTPRVLGNLIAMYEHKIFVQGVIWNIFSFDQWGVELGKQLAGNILPELKNNSKVKNHDSSTNGLINCWKEMRQED